MRKSTHFVLMNSAKSLTTQTRGSAMMRDLNPEFFTFRKAALHALFWAVMIALSNRSLGITPETFFHSPRMVICLTVITLISLFAFVGYPNAPGRERHFVIDEVDTKAKLAPVGLYWRFKTHWYRGHGGRFVNVPMGTKAHRIGRDDLRVIIDHGYGDPTPEFAERVFRLYRDLESVKDGTVEEIEAVVRRFRAVGYDFPKVGLDTGGRFVDG